MKKFIIVIAMLLTTSFAAAQGTYTRKGNNFTQVDNKRGTEGRKTSYTYTTKAGDVYNIYLSKNGRAYINRTSKKTGKEYKQYLGEEVSRQVCKELNLTYVEKK